MSDKLHDLPVEERLAIVKKQELREQQKDISVSCMLEVKCGDTVVTKQELQTTLANVLHEDHLPQAEDRIKKSIEAFVVDPGQIDISSFVRDLQEKHKLLDAENRLMPSGNLSIPLGDESAVPMLDAAAPSLTEVSGGA